MILGDAPWDLSMPRRTQDPLVIKILHLTTLSIDWHCCAGCYSHSKSSHSCTTMKHKQMQYHSTFSLQAKVFQSVQAHLCGNHLMCCNWATISICRLILSQTIAPCLSAMTLLTNREWTIEARGPKFASCHSVNRYLMNMYHYAL